MSSSAIGDRESVVAAFDAFDADAEAITALGFEALTTPERLALLAQLERVRRLLPVAKHDLINQLRQDAAPVELGGSLAHALADRLRITRAEATRRINEAHDLGQRRALTGEPLPPRLPATAAGQREGKIGAGGVAVIRRFFDQLPCWVDVETRERAEAHLAGLATQYRPDQLRKLAERLADCLNPDGNFSDEGPGPPARADVGQARQRRDVADSGSSDPGGPRRPGGGVGQAGRARHGCAEPW